jgi:hypothetical protein
MKHVGEWHAPFSAPDFLDGDMALPLYYAQHGGLTGMIYRSRFCHRRIVPTLKLIFTEQQVLFAFGIVFRKHEKSRHHVVTNAGTIVY